MNCRARRLLSLHCKDPRCHWCECETFLPHPGHRRRPKPTDATLEHLFERGLDGKRDMTVGGERTVLACFRCNNRRGVEYGKKLDEIVGNRTNRLRAELGHTLTWHWRRFVDYPVIDLGSFIDAWRVNA